MQKKDCFLVGTVFKLHGYKGDVNIYNEVDVPFDFNTLDYFLIEQNSELIPFFIDRARPTKPNVILVKFEDVDSEEQALKILKQKVYLPNKFLPEIENVNPDKLIVGFDVIDNTLGKIGIVNSVNDKTSQKLIVVKDGKKEFFIPFHDNFVININLKNKILEVNIPQELIDIN